ncbi:hypothetical protein X758_33145 [Mesorhizobium sp. LSHC416B00]|nr:hypothetical protein X758_33145 [Mesorhizobium sp. LSHC416B00]
MLAQGRGGREAKDEVDAQHQSMTWVAIMAIPAEQD